MADWLHYLIAMLAIPAMALVWLAVQRLSLRQQPDPSDCDALAARGGGCGCCKLDCPRRGDTTTAQQ
jgi:hypothetical protein